MCLYNLPDSNCSEKNFSPFLLIMSLKCFFFFGFKWGTNGWQAVRWLAIVITKAFLVTVKKVPSPVSTNTTNLLPKAWTHFGNVQGFVKLGQKDLSFFNPHWFKNSSWYFRGGLHNRKLSSLKIQVHKFMNWVYTDIVQGTMVLMVLNTCALTYATIVCSQSHHEMHRMPIIMKMNVYIT